MFAYVGLPQNLKDLKAKPAKRCRVRNGHLEKVEGLSPESQGQIPALTVLYVPTSLENGGELLLNQRRLGIPDKPVGRVLSGDSNFPKVDTFTLPKVDTST